MDDSQSAPEPSGLPQGPHFASPPAFTLTPMRLVLEPSGMVVELRHPDLLLGRHSEADIRLPLPDVSRQHCRFQFVNGNWRVVDLKSLNGVFVNDERVEQAVLHPGDRIRIGGFTFVAEMAATPASTSMELAEALFKDRPQTQTFLPGSRRAS